MTRIIALVPKVNSLSLRPARNVENRRRTFEYILWETADAVEIRTENLFGARRFVTINVLFMKKKIAELV